MQHTTRVGGTRLAILAAATSGVLFGDRALLGQTVTINSYDRGYYTEAGTSPADNAIYAGTGYRGFAAFDGITQRVSRANLVIYLTTVNGTASSTIRVNDVTTPLSTLLDGTGGTDAYADLSGIQIGGGTRGSANAYTTLGLSTAGVDYLNSKLNAPFALGISYPVTGSTSLIIQPHHSNAANGHAYLELLYAGDRHWTNSAGGRLGNSVNYANGLVPTTEDALIFDVGSIFEVSGPISVRSTTIRNDTVTLKSVDGALDEIKFRDFFYIAPQAGDNGKLIVADEGMVESIVASTPYTNTPPLARAINVGSTTGGIGTLEVRTGGTVAADTVRVNNDASRILLNGGTLAVTKLDLANDLDRLDWQSGTLAFRGVGDFYVAPSSLFGSAVTLPVGRTLDLSGKDRLNLQNGTLTIDGGKLRVVDIKTGGNPENFTWNSGELEYSSGLEVGPAGKLGADINVLADQTLRSTFTMKGGSIGGAGTLAGTIDAVEGHNTVSTNGLDLDAVHVGGTPGEGASLSVQVAPGNTFPSFVYFDVGTGGTEGELTVHGDGIVQAWALSTTIGTNGGTGRLVVDGAQLINEWYSDTRSIGSSNGHGTLEVKNGGVFSQASNGYPLQLGTLGGTGAIIIQGAGSEASWQRMFADQATITISDGGTLDLAQLTANAGVTVTQSGASSRLINNDVAQFPRLHLNGTYHLNGGTYDGVDVTLTESGSFNIAGGHADVADLFEVNGNARVNLSAGSLAVHTLDLKGDPARLNWTGGKLAVNGSILGLNGSALSVPVGATLGGAGALAADVVLPAGATLSPGNSPGALTIDGDLTNDGSTLLEIGGAAAGEFDRLVVSGALTLNGTIAIDFVDLDNGFAFAIGQSFDLLDFAGTLGGSYALDFAGTPRITWDTSAFATDGVLTVAAVPEPAGIPIAAAFAIATLARSRRRRGR